MHKESFIPSIEFSTSSQPIIVEWLAKSGEHLKPRLTTELTGIDFRTIKYVSEAHKNLASHPKDWDDILISLKNIVKEGDTYYADLAFTTYSALLATNLRRNKEGDKENYADAFVVACLVITSDKKLLIGHRIGGQRGILGGLISAKETFSDEIAELFETAVEIELEQELGFSNSDISHFFKKELKALFRDRKYNRPVLLFLVQSSLTFTSINSKFESNGAKEEHSSIEAVSFEYEAMKKYVGAVDNVTPITLDSLSLYWSLELS